VAVPLADSSILLAGGSQDPNMLVLTEAARRLAIPLIDLRIRPGESPAFLWDLSSGTLQIDGQEVHPCGAFARYDVFAGMQDPRTAVSTRALAWFQSVLGWIYANPDLRTFNRDITQTAANKPAALVAARRAGLRIPRTRISNETTNETEFGIAKPVAGGDYCYPLDDALARSSLRDGKLPAPAIVQERLSPPEIRIYVVGGQSFAFDMKSESLDYRIKQDVELTLLDQVPPEVSALRVLMSELKMDFGAADFKTNAQGQLTFLELNTSPMFARFDQAAGGKLAQAMLEELIGTDRS
jgi:hypothetical protein